MCEYAIKLHKDFGILFFIFYYKYIANKAKLSEIRNNLNT